MDKIQRAILAGMLIVSNLFMLNIVDIYNVEKPSAFDGAITLLLFVAILVLSFVFIKYENKS